MKITESDKAEIKKLITEKEALTSCEIVPMIVKDSDIYPAAHFRAAIIVSFVFSLGLYYSTYNLINPIYYLWIQIPGLLCGYLLAAKSTFIKRLFVTRVEMDQEVTQRAYEAFMFHNLHLTEKHNGLLIFISRFERKIKIISDYGIKSKIENKTWDTIIHQFISSHKNENMVSALKMMIDSVAQELITRFPSNGSTKNELKNDLIIE